MKTLQDHITEASPAASPFTSIPGEVLLLSGQSTPVTIYVIGEGELTAGKIVIEEAHDPEYAGTWSQLEEVALSDLDGGAVIAVHLQPPSANFRAIRARLAEAIEGNGNVTVLARPSGIEVSS